MRVPKRKPGEYSNRTTDPYITQGKYDELQKEYLQLKEKKLPYAREEVATLAELGDFSENAAYQIAKGRLRRINYRLTELEDFFKGVHIIIPPNQFEIVELGHTVVIEQLNTNKQFSYQILGGLETDPAKGIISHRSTLGSELLGLKLNDTFSIKTPNKNITYKIKHLE